MNRLLKQAEKYWVQTSKAWKTVHGEQNVKSVHALRVATRRLQASLALLESVLRRRSPSKARKRVRQVMKKVGPLRDLQVQLRLVRSWERSATTDAFRKFLKQKEREERVRVRKYLSPTRRKKLHAILKGFRQTTAAKLSLLDRTIPNARLRGALDGQRAKLSAARSRAASGASKAIHTLRKTGRRLRYSLEAAKSALDGIPYSEIRSLRKLQDDIGQDRDAQILKRRFAAWQQRELQTKKRQSNSEQISASPGKLRQPSRPSGVEV